MLLLELQVGCGQPLDYQTLKLLFFSLGFGSGLLLPLELLDLEPVDLALLL